MTDERKSDTTSVRIAKIAARGINHPENLTREEIIAVCASALNQFEREQEEAKKNV